MTSHVSPPVQTTPTPVVTSADLARRAHIERTAQDFEASFLSIMFGQMFEGVQTDGPFGGGQAESMWRSFLTDAMGRSVARAGGIGVSAAVQREMIRLQESQDAAQPAAQAQVSGASQ